MDQMDTLELELRRLAEDLAMLRYALVNIVNSLPPPRDPQTMAA